MYFMFTMDSTFLSIKVAISARDIFHLCQFTPLHARVKINKQHMFAIMHLPKVNTLISLCICTC